ncbi:MAG: flagellar biosynthesis anti-sigma factor FlgM [Nitrospira sp.]|nr:flagellar biosynthesis anti-sigma factor FlgM [Nitrospira sp.]MBH0188501.1 flagellar biosynthesis anti-sigma factor FlgM [Nitrospira sp.]MBH0197302.1 flagellar biosynthesis anti-sigma factor FlgM [Nitrospira sp.]
MQISGHGKADHLAKLLLGVQDADVVGAKSSPSRKEAEKDQVHISQQAKELQRIQALAHEPDQARSERLEQIRQAIENGTYDVSGRKVGDALITQVLTDAVL